MLQKNKCCNECSCFERSERVFQDKMDTWKNCSCAGNSRPCKPKMDTLDECIENDDLRTVEMGNMDEFDNTTHAMAYVKNQRLNLRTVKNCEDALEAGTLFDELEKPFTAGGDHCDTY